MERQRCKEVVVGGSSLGLRLRPYIARQHIGVPIVFGCLTMDMPIVYIVAVWLSICTWFLRRVIDYIFYLCEILLPCNVVEIEIKIKSNFYINCVCYL